jgi:hypothetical protein
MLHDSNPSSLGGKGQEGHTSRLIMGKITRHYSKYKLNAEKSQESGSCGRLPA